MLPCLCYTGSMKIHVSALIALVSAVLLGWWLLSSSAERQIRKVFDQVAREVAKAGPEHPFEELSKAKKLARHVGTRLRIEGMGERHDLTFDQENLPRQIALLRRELQTFSVSFDQLTVTIKKDGTAEAFCNAICSNPPSWVDNSRAYALTATLKKADSGDWRFAALHFAPLVP